MRPLPLLLLLAGCARLLGPEHPVELSLPASVQLPAVEQAQGIDLHHWLWIPEVEEEAPMAVLERCFAGEDVVGELPLEVAYVLAAPGQPVRVGSQEVTQLLGDGSFALSDKRGMLVTPVYEALIERVKDQKRAVSLGCAPWSEPGQEPAFPGRLLLILDERLPWETVRELLYTAGQAQLADLAFLVAPPEPFTPVAPASAEPLVLSPAEGTPWATLAAQIASEGGAREVVFAHDPSVELVGIPVPDTLVVEPRSMAVDDPVPVIRSTLPRFQQ